MHQVTAETPAPAVRGFWRLARGFWARGGPPLSRMFSVALLLMVVLGLAASYGMNVWYRVIFDALQSRESGTVLSLSLLYLPLLAGSVVVSVMQLCLRMSMQRRWLAWLNQRLLDRWLRRLATARHDLLRLSRGVPNHKFKVGAPAPLSDLVSFYREAQSRYRVGWNYLAAVNLVETKFGRVKRNSVAGAQGPMQFIPPTWRIYGNGGDIHDPHDAILGAANLLHANGAPPRYSRALRAYNDSGLYVDAVTRFAREIAANPYGVYYLYCWLP